MLQLESSELSRLQGTADAKVYIGQKGEVEKPLLASIDYVLRLLVYLQEMGP